MLVHSYGSIIFFLWLEIMNLWMMYCTFFLHTCRYYDLDAYYRRQIEKEMKKGIKNVVKTERTVFNDEELRRYILENKISSYHGTSTF